MLITKPIPINVFTTGDMEEFILGPRVESLLRVPFGINALKKRVMRVTRDKKRAEMAYYIDLRDMADRLNQVVGQNNWNLTFPHVIDAGDRIVMTARLQIGKTHREAESEELKHKFGYRDVTKKITTQRSTSDGILITEEYEEPIPRP